MTNYNFRAECIQDVVNFIKSMPDTISVNYINRLDEFLPDYEVQIETHLPLSNIEKIMNKIDDSHVMIETLQPEDDYDGERKAKN